MIAELLAASAASLKAVLLFVHLIGLALGLGAATLLDLLVARMLVTGKVAPSQPGFVHFTSAIVTAGLALLWLSGLGLLAYYSAFDLAALQNPKVWAKVAIVAVLTLNGLFIHAQVLPLITRQAGRGLFGRHLGGEKVAAADGGGRLHHLVVHAPLSGRLQALELRRSGPDHLECLWRAAGRRRDRLSAARPHFAGPDDPRIQGPE